MYMEAETCSFKIQYIHVANNALYIYMYMYTVCGCTRMISDIFKVLPQGFEVLPPNHSHVPRHDSVHEETEPHAWQNCL